MTNFKHPAPCLCPVCTKGSKWYEPDDKGPRNAHIANTHKARAIVQENRSIVARILVKELGFPQDRSTLDVAKLLYQQGKLPANFTVPTTIGFQHTECATYQFDTRLRYDGMPMLRGYTWFYWWNTPIKTLKALGIYCQVRQT